MSTKEMREWIAENSTQVLSLSGESSLLELNHVWTTEVEDQIVELTVAHGLTSPTVAVVEFMNRDYASNYPYMTPIGPKTIYSFVVRAAKEDLLRCQAYAYGDKGIGGQENEETASAAPFGGKAFENMVPHSELIVQFDRGAIEGVYSYFGNNEGFVLQNKSCRLMNIWIDNTDLHVEIKRTDASAVQLINKLSCRKIL